MESVKENIRTFALDRLEKSGEINEIHCLADMWGREYVYNKEAMQATAAARRKRYLQWNNALPRHPQDVISLPAELIHLFKVMCGVEGHKPRYGFDVECKEDSPVATLFQLSSLKMTFLI